MCCCCLVVLDIYAEYGPWKWKRDYIVYELIVDDTEAVWVGGAAVHFSLSPNSPGVIFIRKHSAGLKL